MYIILKPDVVLTKLDAILYIWIMVLPISVRNDLERPLTAFTSTGTNDFLVLTKNPLQAWNLLSYSSTIPNQHTIFTKK